MGVSGYWAICHTRGLRLNHERFHETPNGLRNLLMYNLLPQLLRCRRSYRKTKRLQTDKSTHKCTLILLYIIIMLKTSLEIAFRLILHDFLTHGRERVKATPLEKRIHDISYLIVFINLYIPNLHLLFMLYRNCFTEM